MPCPHPCISCRRRLLDGERRPGLQRPCRRVHDVAVQANDPPAGGLGFRSLGAPLRVLVPVALCCRRLSLFPWRVVSLLAPFCMPLPRSCPCLTAPAPAAAVHGITRKPVALLGPQLCGLVQVQRRAAQRSARGPGAHAAHRCAPRAGPRSGSCARTLPATQRALPKACSMGTQAGAARAPPPAPHGDPPWPLQPPQPAQAGRRT